MKTREFEKQESVEMFKGRSMLFFTTVHVIFTILLFLAMTHVQTQMNSHIAQQERENKELREILTNYEHMNSRNGRKGEKEKDDLEIKERNKAQYKTGKSKEMDENGEGNVEEDNDDGIPIILRNKRNTKPSCCGRGQKGGKGEKGSRGKRGRKGRKGDPGIIGAKGDKGDRGPMGSNGYNGSPGVAGQSGRQGSPGNNGDKGTKGAKGEQGFGFSESAHIVGHGGEKTPSISSIVGRAYLLKSWIKSHASGQITYSNGYLSVGQTGYYYIYCQLYSRDGAATWYNFFLYIDSKPVLKAVKQIINSSRKNNTSYIGGVFRIQAGQRISVRTQSRSLFMFQSTESFFGAFMIHP